jgi:VanZ family protein
MRLIENYRLYRFLSIGWMVLIFWLSSRAKIGIPHLFWSQDKLGHFLVFGILAFFYASSFRQQEEAHQLFVPGRDASIADLVADTAGGFFAAVIFYHKSF